MKYVQWTLTFFGMIVLAIIGGGFFLPARFDIVRSVVINAPADRIYDLIADPRLWKDWSVSLKRDPSMDLTFSGPPFGQGAKWSWSSKTEGSGIMEFTRVMPNSRVEYALYLPYFNLRSSGRFLIEETPKGQLVTWTNGGDVGSNPLKHYLAAYMDRMIGPDIESGLANLKSRSEKP